MGGGGREGWGGGGGDYTDERTKILTWGGGGGVQAILWACCMEGGETCKIYIKNLRKRYKNDI